MEEKDIKTITTTKGELRYYRDWGQFEGGIVMLNAKTINRYKQIKNQHPDADECGVFFAFSDKQFADGYKHLVELGKITDGDSIMYHEGISGMYGTQNGITKFLEFYNNRDKPIKDGCDPQEVYFYEYNNYESMYACDGDMEAIKTIIDIWGEEIARTIQRFDVCKSINQLISNKE